MLAISVYLSRHLPNSLSLYIGMVLGRPSQNKLIWFSDAVLLFVVEWRQNTLFLTSELANKAEITILSTRDTTRAWVLGRGIMGRVVGVYKTGYNTCHLGFGSFVFSRLIFCLVLSFPGTMHPVW